MVVHVRMLVMMLHDENWCLLWRVADDAGSGVPGVESMPRGTKYYSSYRNNEEFNSVKFVS